MAPTIALPALNDAPLAPGLYVIATPIGNLRDISFRALATLAAADAVLAEDTRTSKTLLAHYGISTPLYPYHEHNAEQMRPKILGKLREGGKLALISDAGTPLVSDPGYKLVAEVVAEGLPVTGIPGPSAVLAALVLAGLPTDRFFFEGFLPPKAAARRGRLTELAAIPGTLVNLAAGGGMRSSVRFGHPSGTLREGAEGAQVNGQWKVTKALMSRSARILMEGWVRVPGDIF
eukprot:gene45248-60430_t